MKHEDLRKEKGKQIAKSHDLFRIKDDHYRVMSQTSSLKYDVIKTDDIESALVDAEPLIPVINTTTLLVVFVTELPVQLVRLVSI